ncbi:methyltransferase domain-containing protein [Ramlibacter sp. 2FC]|uniref:class I SAM-dependent methyltransferase n=1 Tax=Ramlibacter sp. 2FC TaxID=2502188 RepID=UPI0010F91CA1|nr:methyltransferase domain-containing protein [Ramlibacter sp. 2FC]
MPNPSLIRRHKGLLRHTLDQLLLVDLVRYGVVALRFLWFVKVLGRLRTLSLPGTADAAVADNTISHNLKGLRDLAVNRSHLLVRPLSVIEALPVDARVLSVGPRTEGELMNLAAHGFSWEQISGLDLISYSPKIQLGDMHETKYVDNQFDAVVLGWVLAYSEDPARAAREMIRITRPGGIVAVGVEYSPQSQEQVIAEVGYLPGAKARIGSCEEILGFFGPAVDHVYCSHVVAPQALGSVGALCVIFSVRK